MKSVYEMSIEEMKHISIGEGKKLSSAEHSYLLKQLMEHKVINESDVDLMLAMSMID